MTTGRIVYHYTHMRNLESILRDGLRNGSGDHLCGDGVYLTKLAPTVNSIQEIHENNWPGTAYTNACNTFDVAIAIEVSGDLADKCEACAPESGRDIYIRETIPASKFAAIYLFTSCTDVAAVQQLTDSLQRLATEKKIPSHIWLYVVNDAGMTCVYAPGQQQSSILMFMAFIVIIFVVLYASNMLGQAALGCLLVAAFAALFGFFFGIGQVKPVSRRLRLHLSNIPIA